MNALELRGVRKKFGSVEVLKGIDAGLEEGGFLVLLGPSGCGKSTLLNIIAGLEDPSGGQIEIGGRISNDLHPRDRDIAMVFQSYALYPSMTVRENMAFGLSMRGVDKQTQARSVSEAARILDIEHLLDRKPAALSGGQRQRVAMGRALVRDPGLFLFDEPLSNLDAKLRVQMRSEIKKLHNRLSATVVYVTHDQVEAMTLATTIAVMRDGEIQQIASPEAVYERPANVFVAGFVGSPQMNFLDGVLDVSEGFIVIGSDNPENSESTSIPFSAALSAASDIAQGQTVTIGIRPEAFRVAPGSAPEFRFKSTVSLVEMTGADSLVTCDIAGHEVTARLPAEFKPKIGQDIELTVELDRVHVFDAADQKRIG